MSEKHIALQNPNRRLRRIGASMAVGSLALTTAILILPAGHNAADELPHREVVGSTVITYSE